MLHHLRHTPCLLYKMRFQENLLKMGLKPVIVKAVQIEIDGEISEEALMELQHCMTDLRHEEKHEPEVLLVRKTIELILNAFESEDLMPPKSFTKTIKHNIYHDYTHVAKLFSRLMEIPLKKFIEKVRIEKVKDYINKTPLSLTEIADKLNFSNQGHLSLQFKEHTGISPREFRAIVKTIEHDCKNSLQENCKDLGLTL